MSILISEIETDLYRHYFIQRQVYVHVTPSWGTKKVHTGRYAHVSYQNLKIYIEY